MGVQKSRGLSSLEGGLLQERAPGGRGTEVVEGLLVQLLQGRGYPPARKWLFALHIHCGMLFVHSGRIFFPVLEPLLGRMGLVV